VKLILVIALAIAAGCKSDKSAPASGFAGPGPVASCDHRGEDPVEGPFHQCTEVFEAAQVEAQEKFCNDLAGAKDQAAFARGKACPAEGRQGGCAEPNGTIRWTYAGTEACELGLKFKGASAPARGAAKSYRCGNDKVCIESRSVVDLAKGMKDQCEQAGATFAEGPCPAENLVGRCTVQSRGADSVRSYYAPAVDADGAKGDCEDADGTFAAP
jgi:hypothetical protein